MCISLPPQGTCCVCQEYTYLRYILFQPVSNTHDFMSSFFYFSWFYCRVCGIIGAFPMRIEVITYPTIPYIYYVYIPWFWFFPLYTLIGLKPLFCFSHQLPIITPFFSHLHNFACKITKKNPYTQTFNNYFIKIIDFAWILLSFLLIYPPTVAISATVIQCYVFCAIYITFQGGVQFVPYLCCPSNHSKFSNSCQPSSISG